MDEKPLRVLAPVAEHPEALAKLILPLAAQRRLELTLFHAGDAGILRKAARVFQRLGLPAETVLGEGDPAAEIRVLARARRVDLIAMLTRGRRGLSRFLGSVAARVLRESRVPVLLARPDSSTGPWSLVVAAVDGSARAERVLPFAGRLAQASGSPLRLMRVGGAAAKDYVDRTCARLNRRGVVTLPVVRGGAVAREIARYAKDVGAGVVCLTTHGRRGLPRFLLGSATEELVRRSPCPVLALRA